jgi:hypothetical protein
MSPGFNASRPLRLFLSDQPAQEQLFCCIETDWKLPVLRSGDKDKVGIIGALRRRSDTNVCLQGRRRIG